MKQCVAPFLARMHGLRLPLGLSLQAESGFCHDFKCVAQVNCYSFSSLWIIDCVGLRTERGARV